MINAKVTLFLITNFLLLRLFSFSFLRVFIKKRLILIRTSSENLSPYFWSIKIEKISQHFGIKSCLLKSATLYQFLINNNFYPSLIIGVDIRNQNLTSHAWVEINGTLINEDQKNISNYKVIERIE